MLIQWNDEQGDSGYDLNLPPVFKLLWDGTLLQLGIGDNSPTYVSHLDNNEVCKLLNTIDYSGFFEDQGYYDMPFAGAGGTGFLVNAWKSNRSGAESFYEAVAGHPYFDPDYCRNCPIPDERTIIGPTLANTYFLLKNYLPANRTIAQSGKLLVHFISGGAPGEPWPVKSYPIDNIFDPNQATEYITILEGQPAKEILSKVKNWSTYSDSTGHYYEVFYRPLWPYEQILTSQGYNPLPDSAKVPADYTITCKRGDNSYPILPLDSKNQFWYYAPSGKWAAEVVKQSPDTVQKVRVVNIYGYSHVFSYDPALFGQTSLMVFPRYWSEDNRFFYVNILPGDYQNNTSFENSIGLEQIDASNQKAKYIFVSTTPKQSFAYDISHNGKTVAYIRQGDVSPRIILEDLPSATQREAIIADMNGSPVNYIAAGSIVWSADDSTIYVAATYQGDFNKKSHILSIDAKNPVNENIIFSSETESKLLYDLSLFSAKICPINATLDDRCNTGINLNTGDIFQQ